MNHVTSIRLVLENCEIMEIPSRCIGQFDLDNIHLEAGRIACNEIRSYYQCDHFFIEILPDETLKSVISRLQAYPDITWCELYNDDGETMAIALPWENDSPSGENNKLQSAWLSENKVLYVVVSPTKHFIDYIDKEECDVPNYKDFITGWYT